MRWSTSTKVLAGAAIGLAVAVAAVGVMQIRARGDPYAELKDLCAAEIDRVNRSPAWVVSYDRSEIVGHRSITHLKLQRRVASYGVEVRDGATPPAGVLRFQIARARTTLEGDRTFEQARADGDFEVAFPEEHEHHYRYENGRWVATQRRQHDAFVDWLLEQPTWRDCADRTYGLPEGMIVEKEPDPLAGW
jgi:hypothetical protein